MKPKGIEESKETDAEGKRMTKGPPRKMVWSTTSAPTEPGSAVVLRFAVPETEGMELEFV